MSRIATVNRETKETKISCTLNLDGTGKYDINTGIGFFDHMLSGFARHGLFDLTLKAEGDLYVDSHHTVEDVGIVLGQAFAEAIGDKKGIYRYGDCILPMDEALILCAVDISGRDYLGYALEIPTEKVGTFDTELTEEFWLSFVRNARMSLHLRQLAGKNSHHIIEGAFKAAGRALRQAVAIESAYADEVPSTKGLL
jgi:imidazoleglycerol-phosphate dehydratase